MASSRRSVACALPASVCFQVFDQLELIRQVLADQVGGSCATRRKAWWAEPWLVPRRTANATVALVRRARR